MAELMDGAMQQAPQPGRQFTRTFLCYKNNSVLRKIDEGWRPF
jgi:hypothetical protein